MWSTRNGILLNETKSQAIIINKFRSVQSVIPRIILGWQCDPDLQQSQRFGNETNWTEHIAYTSESMRCIPWGAYGW
jgi:hypothetical protein